MKILGWLFKNICPSLSGCMSRATNTAIIEEFHISLLPIINLHATDPFSLTPKLEEKCFTSFYL